MACGIVSMASVSQRHVLLPTDYSREHPCKVGILLPPNSLPLNGKNCDYAMRCNLNANSWTLLGSPPGRTGGSAKKMRTNSLNSFSSQDPSNEEPVRSGEIHFRCVLSVLKSWITT